MSVLASNPQILHREVCNRDQQSWANGKNCFLSEKSSGSVRFAFRNSRNWKKAAERDSIRVEAFWSDSSKPTTISTIEMEPIGDCDQLDQALVRAQELSQPIIIDWMASWCRKCIYLKPKLEKLAAEYDTKTRFYCVDVNKVPQTLVKRGNISKMPTIQLWKDGEMKEEVIGGHKGWLVMEEVKEMINKFV